MQKQEIHTDWPAMLLSLLLSGGVVGGLILAGLHSATSWGEAPGWAWGFFMLVPLEGLRVVAAGALSDIYKEYAGPWQAAMSFVALIAIGSCLYLTGMLMPGRHGPGMSFKELAAALYNPWVWEVIIAPMAVVVAETTLGLLLFRGDPRAQSARIGAISATTEFCFLWAFIYPLFICIPLVPCLILFGTTRMSDLIFENLPRILFLYAALYFAGKAILLAYLYTARFLRTGRCLIPGEKQEVIDERHAALTGDDPTLGEIMERRQSAK